MPFDRNEAVKHLWSSARNRSSGYCARYTANAIDAGLHSHIGRANQAKDFGPKLLRAGFSPMPTGTSPQSGDIIVFPGFRKDILKKVTKDHAAGHMEMYDGQHHVWISDFKQRGLYPGADYKNAGVQYTLYRYGQ